MSKQKGKRHLAGWVALILLVSSFTANAGALASEKSKPVSNPPQWASDALERWNSAGIIQGYEDGSMRPDRQIRAIEFAVMMNRLFGFQEPAGEETAGQSGKEAWYAKDLSLALQEGYLQLPETGETGKSAEAELTRGEAARSLGRLFGLGEDGPVKPGVFGDVASLDQETQRAIAALASGGYINGYPDGSFKPNRTITRAEMAVILDRLLAAYISESGSKTIGTISGNALLNRADTVLRQGTVSGNLYLTEGIGSGKAGLDRVNVQGILFVRGGVKNVEIKDSNMTKLVVLQAKGAGNSGSLPVITISGQIGELHLSGPAEIVLADGAQVGKVIVSERANASSIKGTGMIASLKIEAQSLMINGKAFNKGEYTDVKVEASSGTQPPVATTPGSSSGGSGSGGGNSGGGGSNSPWTLVWSDEFNGTSLDRSKWTFDLTNGESVGNPGWGNNELEYYTDRPENVKVEDGNLVITAIKEQQKYEGYDYTSARVKTKGLFSKKYGKFEIRAKAPGGKGLWPAIWMLPEQDVYGTWAASGEIDIMEGWGSDTGKIGGTLHYGGQWPRNMYTGKEYRFANGSTTEDYHVYGLEWEPGEIRWYVDGLLYATQNDWFSISEGQPANNAYPAPFDEAFHLLMNLAVGGNFDGNPTADTAFPAQMKVDYVRVYELTGRAYREPVPPSLPKEDYAAGSIEPLPDGNLMRNGDFTKHNEAPGVPQIDGVDNTDYWNLYTGEGGVGSLAIEQIDGHNFAKVTISQGGNQPYSVQPLGIVSLAKGRNYKLSFDAKSEGQRSMSVKLTGGSSRGFAVYSQALQADLGSQLKHYEVTFQMKQDSDAAARIEFNMGMNTLPVWIGNVRLEELDSIEFDHDVPKLPLGDGNHVYNGTFDQGETSRLSYWHVLTRDGAKAAASVDPSERKFNLAIAAGGSGKSSIQLLQRGISLIQGLEYELSFEGKASTGRTIEVELADANGNTYDKREITLGTSTSVQKALLNMQAPSDEQAQLIFHLGGEKGTLQLDNIKLVRTTEYFEPDTVFYPLVNGDFTDELAPWQFVAPEGGGAGRAEQNNGQAKVHVDNSGSLPHSVLFFQEGLPLSKGLTYIVEFDASSSLARQMKATVENSSYAARWADTVQLSSEMKHFSYEFKAPADEAVGLKFLLGKIGSQITDAHEITIDNVRLMVKGARVLEAPALKADSTNNAPGSDIVLSFRDNETWRNAVTSVTVNGLQITGYTIAAGSISLPASSFPAPGNYEIIVAAAGYANAKVTQTILSGDGNLVVNGDFAAGESAWTSWTGDGGSFDVSADQGYAALTINATGPNNWSNQFYQEGIPMQAGKTYELSFKAWSTEARDITVEFSNTTGGQAVFTPTATESTYSATFTVGTNAPLKLNFLIGKGQSHFAVPHILYLDDIVIKEVAGPAGGDLQNGSFTGTTDPWQLYTSDGSNAVMSIVGDELSVDFANYDGWNPWSTQVYQDRLKLESGKTYTLSFEARSTLDGKPFAVELINPSGGKPFEKSGLTLSATDQTWTYEFTHSGPDEQNAKLVFLLGSQNVDGSAFTPHQILLDNVILAEK